MSEIKTKYPVPFSCECAEFKRNKTRWNWYSVWGRIRGQGSPYMVEGLGIAGRCEHEAYQPSAFVGIEMCPKQLTIIKKNSFYEQPI